MTRRRKNSKKITLPDGEEFSVDSEFESLEDTEFEIWEPYIKAANKIFKKDGIKLRWHLGPSQQGGRYHYFTGILVLNQDNELLGFMISGYSNLGAVFTSPYNSLMKETYVNFPKGRGAFEHIARHTTSLFLFSESSVADIREDYSASDDWIDDYYEQRDRGASNLSPEGYAWSEFRIIPEVNFSEDDPDAFDQFIQAVHEVKLRSSLSKEDLQNYLLLNDVREALDYLTTLTDVEDVILLDQTQNKMVLQLDIDYQNSRYLETFNAASFYGCNLVNLLLNEIVLTGRLVIKCDPIEDKIIFTIYANSNKQMLGQKQTSVSRPLLPKKNPNSSKAVPLMVAGALGYWIAKK